MKSINLKFHKLGSHWYPDIPHDDPEDLVLDPRFERLLTMHDKYNEGVITDIDLIEQGDVIDYDGLVQFDDYDLYRYHTTDEEFTMKVWISDRPFTISSRLFFLLEIYYDANFADTVYKIYTL